MGSIYGNRERKDNRAVGTSVGREARKNDKSGSKNNTVHHTRSSHNRSYHNARQNSESIGSIRLRRFIFSTIVNLVITSILIIFACVLINAEYRDIYVKMLFLPIASFCCNFIMSFLNKDILMNIAGSAVVLFVTFLIFVSFSWFVFLWLLFYLANGVLGILIAMFAKRN